MTTTYALIMAGGSGTRLWPRSRVSHPKQFLDITSEMTMLQESLTRLSPLIPPERVLIATNAGYVDLAAEQAPMVPAANILGEPQGRGTAAAIGLAAIHLRKRDPDAIMIVLTADHLIRDTQALQQALAAASEVAGKGWLVTLGITPSYPETGYGYIELGPVLPNVPTFQHSNVPTVNGLKAYQVARFVEKPDLARAEEFVSSGRYTWNSGMFAWKVEQILGEMERNMPALYGKLREIERSLGTPQADEVLQKVWPTLANETIDYGVMEKAERVAVLPVEIGWSDVGSWASVYDVLPHDEQGNAVVGNHLSLDTSGTLIYSPDRLVATIGLEDMIVVDTGDALLICPRSRAQEVKQIVEMLRARGLERYL